MAELAEKDRKLLLFPLNIEMTNRDGKVLLRWYPDEALLPSFVKRASKTELNAVERYQKIVERELIPSPSADTKYLNAWVQLCNEITVERAWSLIMLKNELKHYADDLLKEEWDELEFLEKEGLNLTPYLPDIIFLYTKKGGLLEKIAEVNVRKEKPIRLSTDEKKSEWITDFREAKAIGLGTEISPASIKDCEWLLFFGINNKSSENPEVLKTLIGGKMATGDFGIVPQDAPTNNIQERTSYVPYERDPLAFLKKIASPIRPDKTDAPILSQALLGTGDFFYHTQGSGSSDQLRFNLFKGLVFELADEFYEELLEFDVEGAGKQGYRKNISPIGPLPTIRLGRQPYGILPVTHIDSDSNPLYNYLRDKARSIVGRVRLPGPGEVSYEEWFAQVLKQSRVPTKFVPNIFDPEKLTFTENKKLGDRELVSASDIDLFVNNLEAIIDGGKIPIDDKIELKSKPSLFRAILTHVCDGLLKSDDPKRRVIIEDLNMLIVELGTSQEQLKVLLMETVDLFHSRFDSWYLMRANYLLKTVALEKPAVVGAYGWIESPGVLQESTLNTDEQYTIGPSEIQAATAHLIRVAGVNSENYQLDSKHIQLALHYHAGLKRGSLNDLVLGQLFEQLLRQNGTSYQDILQLRQQFPASTEQEAASDQNGAGAPPLSWSKLMEAGDKPDGLDQAIERINNFDQAIKTIKKTISTLSQLVRLQSLYDLVQSNTSKVASLQAYIDGNSRIPDLDFIKNHRTGTHHKRSVNVSYLGSKDYLDFNTRPTAFLSPIVEDLCNRHLRVTVFATFPGISGRAGVPQSNYGLHLSQAAYFGKEYMETFVKHIIHDGRLFGKVPIPDDWMAKIKFDIRQERMKLPYDKSLERIQKSIGTTSLDTVSQMINKETYDLPVGFTINWLASVEQQAHKIFSLYGAVDFLHGKLIEIKEGINEQLLKEEKLGKLIENIKDGQTKIDICRAIEGVDYHVDEEIFCEHLNELDITQEAFDIWGLKEPTEEFSRAEKLKLKSVLERFQKEIICAEVNARILLSNPLKIRSLCFDMGLVEINAVLKRIDKRESLGKKIAALDVLLKKVVAMKANCHGYLKSINDKSESWSLNLQEKLNGMFIDAAEYENTSLNNLPPAAEMSPSRKELFISYYEVLDSFFEGRVFPTVSFVGSSGIDQAESNITAEQKALLFDRYPYVIEQLRHYLQLEQDVANVAVREGKDAESVVYSFCRGATGSRLSYIKIDQWNDFIPSKEEHIGIAVNGEEPQQEAPNMLLLAVPDLQNHQWDDKSLAQCISSTIDLMQIRMLTNKSITTDTKLGALPFIYLPENV